MSAKGATSVTNSTNPSSDKSGSNEIALAPGARKVKSTLGQDLNSMLNEIDLNNEDTNDQDVFQSKSKAIWTHDDAGTDPVDSYKINLEHEETQMPNAYDATDLRLDESQKRYDLHKTDWQGRMKHKRNKAQAPKHSKETKDMIRRQHENNKVPKIIDMEARDSTRFIDINAKDDTYWDSRNDIDVAVEEIESPVDDVHDVGVNTFKNIVRKPDHPINFCIFEFEDVLCTNMKSIEDQTWNEISNLDLSKLLLAFGGVDRLEDIHYHLSRKIMNENDRVCFVITKELSTTVEKVLERVDLTQYFSSAIDAGSDAKKILSHVVGCDHKIMQFAGGKYHLMLMKLIELMKRDPDNVLYVGHDKDIIDHLSSINICHTYWVKTRGMIHYDLETLAETFFGAKSNANETQDH